jgi:hypothetical protein
LFAISAPKKLRGKSLGFEHNSMALDVSSALLGQLRAGSATAWATPRLTSNTILWQGIADWPRPDIAFEDPSSGATLALEFKPPNQPKREYITGVGQMMTYLRDFEFAGLVLPEKTSDGFPISAYVKSMIEDDVPTLPLVLFSYDKSVSRLVVQRQLIPRQGAAPTRAARRGRGTFWAYWRDLSNYDVFALLRVIDSKSRPNFAAAFGSYWKSDIIGKKARTWEGVLRRKKAKAKITPEERNAFYALRHTGLINPQGQITLSGLELLHVGKIYGPDSIAFLTLLARRILVDGQHLELILWVEKESAALSEADKGNSSDYLTALDDRLVAEGVIPPRPKAASKAHFIRDEPKLWNKLGFLQKYNSSDYFHPGQGYRFDWRKIISVIESDRISS